jgi:putative SOS response-associated peptidase YedK
VCYKVSNKADKSKLEEEFDAVLEESQDESWEPQNELSGFAHPLLPVFTQTDTRKLELMRWGLIPHWASNNEQAAELAKQTLNARAETMFEKPSFRDSAALRRCVIPVTGFYEWQTRGKTKIPYFITPAAGSFFLLGGLYSSWANRETGEISNTFSIVTVAANPMMAEIHNTKQRMPLILPPESVNLWTNQQLAQSEVMQLARPFAETSMKAENQDNSAQQFLF